MELKDRIREVLAEFSEEDMVQVHNAFCVMNDYYEDYIEHMYDLDEYCEGLTPTEIINSFGHINTYDDYFIAGIYGAQSFSYYDHSPVTLYDEIADYCARNEDWLYNLDIKQCIEEYLEEQEEPEYESEEDAAWSNGGEEEAMERYYESKGE